MSGPTGNRPTTLTVGLGCVCVTLATFAFVPPRGDVPSAQTPVAKADSAPATAPPVPARPAVKGIGAYREAFTRPLFPSSRHFSETANDHAQTATVALNAMKLYAVFLAPEGDKAFIVTQQAPKGIWLKPGDSSGGWRVETIRSNSLELSSNGRKASLHLVRDEVKAHKRRQLRKPRQSAAQDARRRMGAAKMKQQAAETPPSNGEAAGAENETTPDNQN